MAQRTSHTQFAFNSGVLSPFLFARSDIDRFAYGARTMMNFIPMLQGPARKRPGTRYVHNLRELCWLVPMVFAQNDAWILAFGDQRISFFTDHGPVLETAKNITGITQANPCVVTSNSHGYLDGDEIYIASVGGMTQLNGRVLTVANKTANTFELRDMWAANVDSTAYSAYTSGGTASRLYKLASPYSFNDLTAPGNLCNLTYAQSEDVLYICVPGLQPRKLTRSGSTNWAFSTLDQSAGPFIGTDPDQTVTVYSGGSALGSQTFTASSAIFTSSHIGSLFLLERSSTEVTKSWEPGKSINTNDVRLSQGHYYKALTTKTTGTITPSHTEGSRFDGDDGVNWQYLHSGYGWGVITAIGGGGTTATVTVQSYIPEGAVGSGNASTQWSFGAWSAVEGWPTHVCFFRERLCFARDTQLWFSVPDDFENFAERDAGVVAPDSAFSLDIRQGFNDSIMWLMPSSDLLVGCEGNEFAVSEVSQSDPFGPSNRASLRGPGYGSRRVAPALINDGVFYSLPSGRVLRELRFDFSSDGYAALNRTAFAEHVTKGGLNSLAFAKEPESVMWAALGDGGLIGMSFEREHQLLAWHTHELGGVGASVFSQAVIPSSDGDRDEWYGCVRRTINGQQCYYLEYMAAHWDESTDDLADMYYVDCGLSADALTSTTIGGLEHLKGESVAVLADGRALGAYTVSASGSVTLSLSSTPTKVSIGLPYTATLESMNVQRPDFLSRIVNVFVKFVSTVFAKAGGATTTDRDTRKTWGAREIGWTFAGYSVASPVPAQTRVVKVKNEGDHGREVYFEVIHDQPTACTVAGWTFDTVEEKAV